MLLEICTASVTDCRVAVHHGAGRIELNSALELGGLTPSPGLMLAARAAVDVPLIAMVRPRPGGFCYNNDEFTTMVEDARWMLAHGADGIAFGMLQQDGSIDLARCRTLLDHVGASHAVFHRAFDMTPDPHAALAQLIDLGVTRVLSSGQAATALEGAALLAELHAQAAGRIEILPGGGVRGETVGALIRRSGCTQIHASLSRREHDPTGARRRAIQFHAARLPDDQFTVTSGARVAELHARLTAIASA